MRKNNKKNNQKKEYVIIEKMVNRAEKIASEFADKNIYNNPFLKKMYSSL